MLKFEANTDQRVWDVIEISTSLVLLQIRENRVINKGKESGKSIADHSQEKTCPNRKACKKHKDITLGKNHYKLQVKSATFKISRQIFL